MNKQYARVESLRLRSGMAKTEYKMKSDDVVENLKQFFQNKHGSVLGFNPIIKKREPDVRPFYEYLETRGINYGIVSSIQTASFPEGVWDYILVPTLAYDRSFYRLGYGGGWYDKFLVNQPDAVKIGISFHCNELTDNLDADRFDIALDHVITDVT